MAKESSSGGGGISAFGVVGLVFIVLKLLEIAPVASWPWVWVLAPFWMGATFGLFILLIVVLVRGGGSGLLG